jgi:hypothetical protein
MALRQAPAAGLAERLEQRALPVQRVSVRPQVRRERTKQAMEPSQPERQAQAQPVQASAERLSAFS